MWKMTDFAITFTLKLKFMWFSSVFAAYFNSAPHTLPQQEHCCTYHFKTASSCEVSSVTFACFLSLFEASHHILKQHFFNLSFAFCISDTVYSFTPYSLQTCVRHTPDSNISINSNVCLTLKFVFFFFCVWCINLNIYIYKITDQTQCNTYLICNRIIYILDTHCVRSLSDKVHIYDISTRLLEGSTDTWIRE
jgi:hypothetical protein